MVREGFLCFILKNSLKANNYIMLITLIILGITSYFASLLLLKDKYFKDVLVRFKILRESEPIKDENRNNTIV